MKCKRIISCFVICGLLGSSVQVSAGETENMDGIQKESVELAEEDRYDSGYYTKPEVIFTNGNHGTRRSVRAEQTFEDYMVKKMMNLETSIDISSYNISKSDIAVEFFRILNNNPELFYVNKRFSYSYSNNIVLSLDISYMGTREEINRQTAEFEKEAWKAAAQTDPSMTQAEKALVVHDYLIQNCEYDQKNYLNGNISEYSHTAYGALINKIAVCDGYANAYSYIMEDKLGIPCEIVSSERMAHAWNMIKIDGQWYHVDATWDDPVWDCIGRVMHDYFLLSDAAISEKNRKHYDWDGDYEAYSAKYDNAFWSDISSSITYYYGEWYYSKYQDTAGDRAVKLVKKSSLFDERETAVSEGEVWTHGNVYYTGSYMYPVSAGDMLYFNTRDAVWSLDSAGNITKIYEPELAGGRWIYGFTVRGDEMMYVLWDSPNFNDVQTILKERVPEADLPQLQGISAEDVNVTYSGTAAGIVIKGIKDGDIVQYALGDAPFSYEQPVMVNAGNYEVRYIVRRRGYASFESKTNVRIARAIPEYDTSGLAGLTCEIGKTLSDVGLPKGFAWQSDASEQLMKEGEYVFIVKYIPDDKLNYEDIRDITVTVRVSCPGHSYEEKVVIPATLTQKGKKTYTCRLCGHTYSEDIPVLEKEPEATQTPKPSQRPDVTQNPEPTGPPEVTQKPDSVGTPVSPDKPVVLPPVNNSDIAGVQNEPKESQTAVSLSAVKIVKLKKGKGNVKLTWKKTAGADGYVIYMKTGKNGYKKIKTVTKGNIVSYTKKGLKKKTTYQFRICAYKKVNGVKVYGVCGKAKKAKLR